MATKQVDYPADGTIDDLSQTCQADEDIFRARLKQITNVEAQNGTKGNRATYERIPFDQPYKKKKLSFQDITNATADQQRDIAEKEMQQGHAEAFRADVFLKGKPAKIIVYREQ